MQDAVFVSALLGLAARAAAGSVSATPHDSYSSSVGVLGCKIDTNRVAYWPGAVDCNNLCVKLSYGGRSVHLLRVDQSGGAYDISYDAWNYLQTGASATASPIAGGGVDMEYEEVDASACAGLLHTDGHKLPLSASNSMNYLASCLADASSWVAQNYVLYNICDAICSLGHDEVCTLDLATSNQPSCPHTLGLTSSLAGAHVYNIEYPSGKAVDAATQDEVAASVALGGDDDAADGSSGGSGSDAAAAGTTTAAAPTTAPTSTTAAAASPGVFVPASLSGHADQASTTAAAAAAATPSSSSDTTTTATSTGTLLSTTTVVRSATTSSCSTTEAAASSAAPAAPTTTTAAPSSAAAATTLTKATVTRSAPASVGTTSAASGTGAAAVPSSSSSSSAPSVVAVSGASAGGAASLRAAAVVLAGVWFGFALL